MQFDFKPKWTVSVEGDNRQIFNAFRDGKKVLNQKFYDEWLDSRWPMFDDDPDGPFTGHFEVEGTEALMELLSLLWGRVPNPRVNLKVNLSARGEKDGVKADLCLLSESERQETMGQRGCVEVDRIALSDQVLDAAIKARDILEDAIGDSRHVEP